VEVLVMFADSFKGRRIFVTGHTGFKGVWLTLWLTRLGAQVTGYALDPPTDPSLFDSLALGAAAKRGAFTDLRGDVRDRERLRRALEAATPDVVFHLAAQPMVRRSYAEPVLTYETNVMGTVNLLEAVRGMAAQAAGPLVVVTVTSDKCYENLEARRPYVEGDALGGHDPYSSSKACAELATSAFRRSFFSAQGSPAVVTARAGNVLGGGDWGEDRILPDCVRALAANEPIEVRNPDAVRPWQHVLESLSGYLCLAAALLTDQVKAAGDASADGAWNFGPRDDALVSVREVVESVVVAWGAGSWRPAPDASQQPHEAGLLVLDSGKAADLGWRPAWSAHAAVASAVRWYKACMDGAGAGELTDLCLAEIDAYCSAAARAGAEWALDEAVT
jgi:CDP-glucose 4,6-dehydratase